MTPEECGITTITTTPHQALSGTRIGAGPLAQCSTCARSVGEASQVALRAHRFSDEARWSTAALYCTECLADHGTITAPTAGASEIILAGHLEIGGDAASRTHRLVFAATTGSEAVLDYAGADEGSRTVRRAEADS